MLWPNDVLGDVQSMERPTTIAWFERLYAIYVAFSFAGTNLALGKNSEVQELNAQVGGWMIPVSLVLPLVIAGLIWFFIARRASQIAAWVATLLLIVNLVLTGIGLLRWHDGAADSAAMAISLTATALFLLSVIMLWRAESLAWFRMRRVRAGA